MNRRSVQIPLLLVFIVNISTISYSDIGRPGDSSVTFPDSWDSPIIIFGQKVQDRTAYGWMAHLKCVDSYSVEYSCGGSLIKPSYVLTAAHCMIDRDNKKMTSCTILLGGLTRVQNDEPATEITRTAKAADITIHPSYNFPLNDLAVIKLNSPVDETSSIYRIRLPASTSDFGGKNVTIVGWGLDEKDDQPSDLTYAKTRMRDACTCEWYINCPQRSRFPFKNDSMVCYGGFATEGICSGDSGGPVVIGSGRRAVQLAVNSFVMTGPQSTYCPDRASVNINCTSSTTNTRSRTRMSTSRPRTSSVSGDLSSAGKGVFLDFLMRVFFSQDLGREAFSVTSRSHGKEDPFEQESSETFRRPRQTLPCIVTSPSGGMKVAFFKPWIESVTG